MVFYRELIAQCKKHQKFEFTYSVECWGVLWFPWFIYIDGHSLAFSTDDISETDLQTLVNEGSIERVEEMEPDSPIVIKTVKYRTKNHGSPKF